MQPVVQVKVFHECSSVKVSCKSVIDILILVQYLQDSVADHNVNIEWEDASQHTEVITQP